MTQTDERPATRRPVTLSRTWRDRAACFDTDPEQYFAHATAVTENAKAKAVCVGCPVRLACLREALGVGPSCDGVWGGASQADRQKAYRRTQRAGLPSTVENLVVATERVLAEAAS